MLPSSIRLASAAVLGASLAACSSGGGSLAPAAHRAPGAHAAKTTFTIKWTNPTATAAVRRKDSISPSAQSVTVTINGILEAEANRTAGPTQAIVLDAPVGSDHFAFAVYDQANAAGNLLGTAVVTQQIVDGAANTISASIQASCYATNISYANDDPFARMVLTPISGISAQSLQSIVLGGPSPATLVVQPQDVDGNVIISGPGGKIAYTITGSANVTSVDGSHLSLLPQSGSRTTTPDTLTAAAPGCYQSTVAVQHSPVILAQDNRGDVLYLDWYGDEFGSALMSSADAIIGYDTVSGKFVTYNTISGQVSSAAVSTQTNAVTLTPLYSIAPNSLVTWSNYLHSIFALTYSQSLGATTAYTYQNGHVVNYSTPIPSHFSDITGSTVPFFGRAFAGDLNALYSFDLTNFSATPYAILSSYDNLALATDDSRNALYTFNNLGPTLTSLFSQSLVGAPNNSDRGFTAFASFGATDTDASDIYAIVGGVIEASSYSGTPLSGFGVINLGPAVSLTVLSTNE